ncbi:MULTISPECIES: SRPBCC domain-containing protein [Kocuria]|uniref:SRPBCC domain-containing protein n=1 Tax=Kocuria TaxID=57493 RepID=UPI0007E93E96|nr:MULTISPECIES: SRPBCC domain-containing protein [Kocuria]MCG7432761.1 SRPBCC domain-containing protein [Kocuria indica]MCT1724258.1 SRPBCC domain-containing protein [Kocuria marina]MCT1733791.1 SRPBCC domain-containing protein [Kocuria marina]MCT2360157.1 SRPBCC domain-containing protein [Kocuria marina]MDT0120759.1 SRPBCC domain-containing protein [Kocuria sp. PD6]
MSEKSITVSRLIDAPAEEIFEILTLPAKHPSLDASGTVISGTDQRIQNVGDVFVMNMHAEMMGGDYKTENHVTGLDPNKLIAWKPCPEGTSVEDNGWEWVYELQPEGSDSTTVTLTYSWEHANPKVTKKISFPLFGEKVLEESLERLASTVAGS